MQAVFLLSILFPAVVLGTFCSRCRQQAPVAASASSSYPFPTLNAKGVEVVYQGDRCPCGNRLPVTYEIPKPRREQQYQSYGFDVLYTPEDPEPVRYLFDYQVDVLAPKKQALLTTLSGNVDKVVIPATDCHPRIQEECTCKTYNPKFLSFQSCPVHSNIFKYDTASQPEASPSAPLGIPYRYVPSPILSIFFPAEYQESLESPYEPEYHEEIPDFPTQFELYPSETVNSEESPESVSETPSEAQVTENLPFSETQGSDFAVEVEITEDSEDSNSDSQDSTLENSKLIEILQKVSVTENEIPRNKRSTCKSYDYTFSKPGCGSYVCKCSPIQSPTSENEIVGAEQDSDHFHVPSSYDPIMRHEAEMEPIQFTKQKPADYEQLRKFIQQNPLTNIQYDSGDISPSISHQMSQVLSLIMDSAKNKKDVYEYENKNSFTLPHDWNYVVNTDDHGYKPGQLQFLSILPLKEVEEKIKYLDGRKKDRPIPNKGHPKPPAPRYELIDTLVDQIVPQLETPTFQNLLNTANRTIDFVKRMEELKERIEKRRLERGLKKTKRSLKAEYMESEEEEPFQVPEDNPQRILEIPKAGRKDSDIYAQLESDLKPKDDNLNIQIKDIVTDSPDPEFLEFLKNGDNLSRHELKQRQRLHDRIEDDPFTPASLPPDSEREETKENLTEKIVEMLNKQYGGNNYEFTVTVFDKNQ